MVALALWWVADRSVFAFKPDKTAHIFPTRVSAEGWQNADFARIQELAGTAPFDSFSAENSAYVVFGAAERPPEPEPEEERIEEEAAEPEDALEEQPEEPVPAEEVVADPQPEPEPPAQAPAPEPEPEPVPEPEPEPTPEPEDEVIETDDASSSEEVLGVATSSEESAEEPVETATTTEGEAGALWRTLFGSLAYAQEEDAAACVALGVPCRTIEFSGFDVGELDGMNLRQATIGFSFASAGQSPEGGRLLVRYYRDGSWRDGGEWLLDRETSNAENGGYFSFGLDDIRSWEEVRDLRVVVEYAASDPYAGAELYLDGVWVDATYREPVQDILTGETAEPAVPENVAFSLAGTFSDDPRELRLSEEETILFPYTDDMDDELFMRADGLSYAARVDPEAEGGFAAKVLVSITNTRDFADSFRLFAAAPGGSVHMIEQFTRNVPRTIEVPVLEDEMHECAEGWEESDGGFACAESEEERACDEVSEDGAMCIVHDVQVGTETKTEYEHAWVAAEIEDSPGGAPSTPRGYEIIGGSAQEFDILPGQTLYFRVTLASTKPGPSRFVLVAEGDSYAGDLDSAKLAAEEAVKAKADRGKPRVNELLSDARQFEGGELPQFTFRFTSQRSLIGRFFNRLLGRENDFSFERARLVDGGGAIADVPVAVERGDDGEWKLSLKKQPRVFRPGAYTLEFTVKEGGEEYTETVEFIWGTLVFNAHKSIYAPGEEARLSMAVLDDAGDTICDAILELAITDPDGAIATIPVEQTGECGPNNVIEGADYAARYTAAGPGIYGVALMHLAEDGRVLRSVTDSFEVREKAPFSIERRGATRIWPVADYSMTLELTALEDFDGQFIEAVPEDFIIVDSGGAESDIFGGAKRLTWDVSLQAGETVSFTYSYDAPDISPYLYLLGPAEVRAGDALPFVESRQWKIASDAVGNLLLYWDGASIPAGWTCVSCAGGDAFFQRLVMGSATPGVNGGATTHTHTASGAVTASGSGGPSNNTGGTSDIAATTHTHAYAPTIGTGSNLPPYRNLVIIQANTTGEVQIPAGAIAMFDVASSSLPAGWTRYDAQDGFFARGESIANRTTTGGAATHTHTIGGNTSNASGGINAGGSGTNRAGPAHNHSVSSNTGAVSTMPPYIEALFARVAATSTAPDGMIGMWTGDEVIGWDIISGSGGAFEDRFVLASSTYGATGGAATHSHANVTGITSGSASGAAVSRQNTGTSNGALFTHTHSVSVTGFSTVNHLPPYRTAVFAKRAGGPAPSTPTIHTPFESEKLDESTPALEFTSDSFDADLVYQVQWDDDADLDVSPLGDRSSDDESGCSPNCFENTENGGDTSPFTDNQRVRFTIPTPLVSGTTYYFRVRAQNSGSELWSGWATTTSFTYVANTDPSQWFQTDDAQFDLGTLDDTGTFGEGAVRIEASDPVEALVAYGEGTVQTPRYRIWSGTAWSAEASAQSVGGTIQWVITRAGTTRDEYLLGTQDASNDVNVQVFNGESDTWGNLQEMTTGVSDNTARGFDIAYESQSGRGMVVYCDGDADPSYRIWDGSSWSGATSIDLTLTNACEFIKLASDPTSDEIVLVARDTAASATDYEAMVWDGAEWTSSVTLGSMGDTAHEGIAVEYEESGNQAVVAVSNGNASSFLWMAWNGTEWTTPATQAIGDDFEAGVLKRDKGSDTMALCYIDQDVDLGIVRWTGSGWATFQEFETGGNDFNGRPITCEYEITAGRDGFLMIPYSDTTAVRYQFWNGSSLSGESSLASIGDSWTVSSVRTGEGKILALAWDDSGTQYDFSYWDGSVWSADETLETSPSVTANPWREPAHMAAQIFQEAEGTITSPPVDFSLVPDQPTWGEASWRTTEPAGTDVILQVMQGPSCATPVSNTDLPGNSTGFSATSSPLDLSGLSTTTYSSLCLRATLSSESQSTPTLDEWGISWERQPRLTQTSFRWYANANAITPSDAWPVGATDLEENDPIVASYAPGDGSILRLRMNVLVENVSLSAGALSLKLQYAEGVSCSAESAWQDVGEIGSTTAAWRGHDNAAVSDGATLPSTLLSGSDVSGTYEEENDSAVNPSSASANQEIEWDFVLRHNALPATDYCFRAVTDSGTAFNEYDRYPLLVTNQRPGTPSLEKPFDNERLASTTPWFEFAGEDPESNDLTYQIQVDDSADFSSPVLDRDSQTALTEFTNIATPSDKDPFTSGQMVRFIPSSALSNGTTYYWRVRSRDRTASGAWSDWSEAFSVTITNTVSITTWHQTTEAQFDTDGHEDTEATASNDVALIGGFTSGTTTSSAIDFDWRTTGNAWGQLSWNDTETSSDVKYHLEYLNGSEWELIPDSALSGNAAGFDTSPVSLLGLGPLTYNEIRIRANLTDSGASPRILDWTVEWGNTVAQPTQLSLFDNEKTGTTTPSFTFLSDDPDGDDLAYQISWSSSPLFTSSTTRESSAHAGFQNVASTSDSSPFTSGDVIRFTIQSGDALTDGNTYWWRVRARDPGGANVWSAWSPTRSLTVDSAVGVSTWFQTTDEQFDTDALNGIETSGGDAQISSTIREAFTAYGEGTVQTPRYRIWNGTSWSTEGSALSIGTTIRFIEAAAAPTRPEYILGTLGASGVVDMQVFNSASSTWGDMTEIVATVPDITQRGFDVAYETDSGDAIAVACSGTEATYKVWNGTSWSGSNAIALAITGNCEWVQMASDPESDEIIAVFRNDISGGTDYQALVWNGSSWGNSLTFGSQNTANNEGIAIEYEESGGQAVVVVSNGTASSFAWRAWNGSSWSGAATQAIGDDFAGGRLCRDAGTDNMALVYIDFDNDIGVVRWNGSAWAAFQEFETGGNSQNGRPVTCEFETEGSRDGFIMIPYSDTTAVRSQFWNGSSLSGEASISTITDSWEVRSARTGDGTILVVAYDDANTEYDFSYWNGTAWSAEEVLETTSITTVTPASVPIDIVARRYPALTSGSIVSSPIIFQDGDGLKWDEVQWNDTTPGASDILYRVEYLNGSAWEPIPDSDLPGNAAGASVSPIDISSLDWTTDYGTIRLAAEFMCDDGDCPSLHDWTVTWSEGITVSGTLKGYNQLSDVTSGTIAIAVNGELQLGKTYSIDGGGGSSNWYDDAWGERKKLTVNGALVSETLTDYPLLVSITDSDVQADALSSGNDILFTGEDGETKLDHEIESYNSATGELVAWVRIPSLSSATNTEIYLYYGNAAASDQQNPSGVWDEDYVSVWHMTEPNIVDSTANNITGSATNMSGSNVINGMLGDAIDFVGSSQQFITTADEPFDLTDNFTISTWMRTTDNSDDWARMIDKINRWTTGYGIGNKLAGPGGYGFIAYWSGGWGGDPAATLGPVFDGEWYHVTAVVEGGVARTYADGSLVATYSSNAGQALTTNDLMLTLGKNASANAWWTGALDEVRVSATPRSAGWIATEYNNQSNPGAFVAVGSAENPGGGPGSPGVWSIENITAFAGDVITVFVSGATTTNNRAVAVTVYDGVGDIAGVEMFRRHLAIGSDDNPTVTNAHLALFDNTASGGMDDLFHDVDGGNDLDACVLSGCDDVELWVRSGSTYRPDSSSGGNVATHDIEINGTLVADGNAISVSGSWDNNGTFTAGASTVIFNAASTTETVHAGSSGFTNVTFGESGSIATWNLAAPLDVNGNLAVNFGRLSKGAQALTIGGNLSIGASGLWTKGTATTTFDGTGTASWSDASTPKRDIGIVVIDGTAKTVQLGSSVRATNILIASDDTLSASAGNHGIEVLGNWTNQNAFIAMSGTVTFSATSTGRTITPGSSNFHNIAFNGTGNWAFNGPVTANNNFTISAGVVTMPTSTATIGGSFAVTGGSFMHNNGTVLFNGAGTKTIQPGAISFYDLTFNGAGSWSFPDGNATSSRHTTITNGTVTLPSGVFAVGGSFLKNGGSFAHNNGTLRLYASNAQDVRLNNSTLYDLTFAGSGSWSFLDTNASVANDVRFESGTATLPGGTLSVGGSWLNDGGAFTHNSGIVRFDSSDTGETIEPGGSWFGSLLFDSASGGWTILENATSGAATLANAASFTLASGETLAVLGAFTNSLAASSTDWTGSTLVLDSDSSFSINTKAGTGDNYGTLVVGSDTDVKMWNSSADTTTVDPAGSLYSQDHAGADGDLYIWGDYVAGGAEHWSYANDFDGASLSGSERQANVRFASGAGFTSSNNVNIIGTANATTTIANQGSGAFSFSISGGTTTAQYYQMRNTDASGLSFSGTPHIASLADGDFELSVNGGTSIALADSVIDANPALQIERVRFETAVGSGSNVAALGSPSSYWWFRNSYGGFDGEDNDDDPGGNPGNIRWDDSSFAITVSGTVYADKGTTPMGNPTCDGSTDVVRIVVDGGASFTGSCDSGDGSYSIAGVTFIGDATFTAYLDTNGGERAAAVTRTATADITGLDLYADTLIVREESTSPLTIGNLAVFDSSDDSDLFFAASSSLAVAPGNDLYVWSGKTFQPGGDSVLGGGLHLAASSTFMAAGAQAHSIGGDFITESSSNFSAASSSVTFTASGSAAITLAEPLALWNADFDGTGSWNLSGATTTVQNTFTISGGTLGGTGSILVQSGSMTGDGSVAMTGGTVRLLQSGTLGGNTPWQFFNLTLGDATTSAATAKTGSGTTTIAGVLAITANHTLEAGSSGWNLAGGGTPFVMNGTFDVESAPFTYSATTSANVADQAYAALTLAPAGAGSPTYAIMGGTLEAEDLTVGGAHPVIVSADVNDPTLIVTGDVAITTGSTLVASNVGAFEIGGSWTNDGTFTHSGGTVLFESDDGGETISAGSSSFYDVEFDNATGGWTILEHATSSHDFELANAASFTLQSGATLAVGGAFTNSVGGSATDWTGSTLSLFAGSYSINDAASGADAYGTLAIGPGAHVRMWHSSAAGVNVDPAGSLYSQDHANVDGDLAIWGAYERASGSDYWSYETDFDGSSLGGSARQANVRIAPSSSVTLSGGILDIIGTSSATTTIDVLGSGAYAFNVTGGSFNAQHYSFRNLDENGLALSGSPTIPSLSDGDFELALSGGTLISVAGSVIDANPLKIVQRVRFATSSGATTGTNVAASGSTASSWKFNLHFGGFDGEEFDDDPAGDPGYLRWDDSAAQITVAGTVYSDEGETVSSVCDGSTPVVMLMIQGAGALSASCDTVTGAYAIPGINYNPGDVLTLFLNGTAARAANIAADPNTNISNMDLYENRVIVRHEDTAPITIADMAVYDSDEDADIPFDAEDGAGDTLTLPPETKLIVWAGKTFAPAGAITLQSGGSGEEYDGSLEVQAGATFSAAGTQEHSVGGSFIIEDSGTLLPAQSVFTMTATTTGKTIQLSGNSFYDLTFDGAGGNWAFAGGEADIANDFTVASGTVTLASGTTTVGGSFENTGGSLMHNNGLLLLTAGDSGNVLQAGGSNLFAITFDGAGSWTFADTNATSSGSIAIDAGAVALPGGVFAVGGSFEVASSSASFAHSGGVLRLTSGASDRVLRGAASPFNNVAFVGGGEWDWLDDSSAARDVLITSGTIELPTALAIGGSFQNTGGAFTHASGTITFTATSTGHSVTSGGSWFTNLVFASPTGGWTITDDATSTGSFALQSAASFTLAGGQSLTVNGPFTNLASGAATTWNGSTLILSGASSTVNTKATGDQYDNLIVGPDTNVRMWNSAATSTTVDATGSLYSQDHAGVDGDLYIWGDYERTSGADYWSTATDFDGTALGGGGRHVDVRIAPNSALSFTGGTLAILGTSASSTSVAVQGSGAYALEINGAALNAQHYSFRNLDEDGLVLAGTSSIISLSNGDFELAANGGAMISLDGTVIDANASKQIHSVAFGTSSGIASGYNVALVGSTTGSWTFIGHSGNYDGEAFDSDGPTEELCGAIRWNDSECLFVSQEHFRFRNDDGGEGAPADEWFDGAWSKRKRVGVTNETGENYTDLPVKMSVQYDSDMQADFDDLRFTDESGTTSLPYWIEDFTSATEATLWVQVPSLAGSGDAVIYMYYGNIGASSAADGEAVFAFFDDFEDDDIAEYAGDASLFNVGTSFNYAGEFGLDAGTNVEEKTTSGIYRTGPLTGQGDTIRFFQYVEVGEDEPCTLFGVGGAGNNYALCLDQYPGPSVMLARDVTSNDGSGTVLASTTADYATAGSGWYEVVIDWFSGGFIDVDVFDPAGSLFASVNTTNTAHTSGGVGFSFWAQHGGWDFYSVRPYTATPPTVVFGAEGEDSGATWAAPEDGAYSGGSVDENLRLRFSIQNTGTDLSGQLFRLQVAPKGASLSCEAVPDAGYDDVPTQTAGCGSSPACMATSSQFANLAPTAALLSHPADLSFAQGALMEDPSNQTASTSLPSFAATEVEYNFRMTGNAVENAYCFRVVNGAESEPDNALDNYQHVAEIVMAHGPIISSFSLNDGADIALTEGVTTTISATGTVTDFNGFDDIVAATSTIYRGAAGASCAADPNSCYPVGSCTLTDCAGNSCALQCTAAIHHFADPTDAGTYESDEWFASVWVQDSTGLTDSAQSFGVELLSLFGLAVDSDIDYGTLALGESSTSTAQTNVFNTGNTDIDLELEGTNLGSIEPANQAFATSTFVYASCSICQFLTGVGDPTPLEVDLPKPTSTSTPVADEVYWGINVPSNSAAGSFQGTNTFWATAE